MKKIISLLFILVAFAISVKVEAQIRYPFGSANFTTITVNNDTITAAAVNNSVNYYYSTDTLLANTVVYATTASSVKAGDK